MAKKVFIAAGHGGSDPGAVANGLKEKDLNLTISLACQSELERHGVTVKMSRTKDENETLNEQVAECNAFNPDLAVNIHNNAGGGDGAEVFHSVVGGTGKTLATNILNEIVAIGQNSRGVKTKKNSSGGDYYGFIRDTKAHAVIVECCFLDNKKDVQIIDTTAEQKAMGVAIAKGILKTLGIAYKAQTTASSNATNTTNKEVCTVEVKVLKKGNKNSAVKALQLLLIGYGISCGKSGADGDFGSNTDTAVRSYQKKNGLTVDGIVGTNTWNKLLGIK